jgi:hypothetical protein
MVEGGRACPKGHDGPVCRAADSCAKRTPADARPRVSSVYCLASQRQGLTLQRRRLLSQYVQNLGSQLAEASGRTCQPDGVLQVVPRAS